MFFFPMRGNQTIRVDSDTENLDLAKYNFDGALRVTIVVDSGILLGSGDDGTAALYCSTTVVPERSRVTVLNKGNIWACNGRGGNGATSATNPGGNGATGGTAIELNCDLVITNSQGTIVAGGGGGGGGSISQNLNRGGGGAGFPGGSGYTSGETAQYGFGAGGEGAGGAEVGRGGDCDTNLDGTDAVGVFAGNGGDKGNAINASGNTVTFVSGASNVTGDII